MNSAEQIPVISPCANRETEADDEDLIVAARNGCAAAFGEIQKLYSQRLYRRILLITRNREDAEDALQDTFLRAYRALPGFEGRSKFSTWLTRIAINSTLMILRKHRTRPESSLEQQSGAEEDGAFLDVPDHALNPEQIYDQHQRCDAALRAIQRLDPKLRTAMRIRISRDDSMQEIAQSLGISSASVKARLHRARKRLTQSPAFRDHNVKLNLANRRALHAE